MAIEGTGKAKRESSKLFMNVGISSTEEWELLGKGIEDMSRERNNNVESVDDVTGSTETNLTKGKQTTSVDPVKFTRDSKVSKILYDIYKYDKELSDVEYPFLEVFTEDKVTTGEFGAFKQIGVVDLKSWGGDTTGVNAPFDINWIGEKIHGSFNPTTKKFTPEI